MLSPTDPLHNYDPQVEADLEAAMEADQESWEGDDLDPEDDGCPVCGGDTVVLGSLGFLVWRRCRCCGMESHS